MIIPRLETDTEEVSDPSQDSQLANALLSLDRGIMLKEVAKLGIQQIHWFPFGPKYEAIKMRITK